MGIKEAFENLTQSMVEDRTEVTNLTDANRHLATQVCAQSNNMTTKDAAIEIMSKLMQQLQGEIKTLKSKQAIQTTSKTNPSSYNKVNWWSG